LLIFQKKAYLYNLFCFSVPFKDHPKYNPRRRTSACPSASSSSALSSPHPGNSMIGDLSVIIWCSMDSSGDYTS